jgi:phosphoglycerate dehydrogenase-like enzyme
VSKRVLCFYPLEADARERLRSLSPALDIVYMEPDAQSSVDALRDSAVEVLLANFYPGDPTRLPALKWLGLVGAGVEHLRKADPWSRGITVTNGSGLHGTAIAEYTLSSMLLFAQRVAERQKVQGGHGWPPVWTDPWLALLGSSLRGKTVTVVGYGSIGREIARLARAFGMRVLAVKADPSVRIDRGYTPAGLGDPDGSIPERVAATSELRSLFGESDFAVLTLPFTPKTDRIVDAAAIAALPPHAVLVNVARGRVLDEDALRVALERGALRGAVLDVATVEPVSPDAGLWAAPNIVLTPHVSAIQDPRGWWGLVGGLMSENLARYASGRALLNVVDGKTGY